MILSPVFNQNISILDLLNYFHTDIPMFASYDRPVDAEGTRSLNFNTYESKKKFNDLINQTVKELVEKY